MVSNLIIDTFIMILCCNMGGFESTQAIMGSSVVVIPSDRGNHLILGRSVLTAEYLDDGSFIAFHLRPEAFKLGRNGKLSGIWIAYHLELANLLSYLSKSASCFTVTIRDGYLCNNYGFAAQRMFVSERNRVLYTLVSIEFPTRREYQVYFDNKQNDHYLLTQYYFVVQNICIRWRPSKTSQIGEFVIMLRKG